jgi:hypothetical protein
LYENEIVLLESVTRPPKSGVGDHLPGAEFFISSIDLWICFLILPALLDARSIMARSGIYFVERALLAESWMCPSEN